MILIYSPAVVEWTCNLTKGVTAMDKNVVEMVESLDEKQLNLFLAYLEDIVRNQQVLPCSDQTEKQ